MVGLPVTRLGRVYQRSKALIYGVHVLGQAKTSSQEYTLSSAPAQYSVVRTFFSAAVSLSYPSTLV